MNRLGFEGKVNRFSAAAIAAGALVAGYFVHDIGPVATRHPSRVFNCPEVGDTLSHGQRVTRHVTPYSSFYIENQGLQSFSRDREDVLTEVDFTEIERTPEGPLPHKTDTFLSDGRNTYVFKARDGEVFEARSDHSFPKYPGAITVRICTQEK